MARSGKSLVTATSLGYDQSAHLYTSLDARVTRIGPPTTAITPKSFPLPAIVRMFTLFHSALFGRRARSIAGSDHGKVLTFCLTRLSSRSCSRTLETDLKRALYVNSGGFAIH
jgi:hypothetical protein